MGTRSNRRSRRSRRGLASFVSFLLLFAFALGQGSSLFAVADTDPVATEDVAADGRAGDVPLPVDGAVEEAPAEEAPAEEASAADDGSGDASAAESAAPARRTAPKASQLKTARADRGAGILSHGGLHGGDISLDYVAAGPFTYSHATGLGTNPPFGYNDRTISKTDGVVESLEGGDFACDDLVTFFTQVVVEDGAGSGSIELDYAFGAETTGQPGLGFDDIVSVAVNTDDDGNVGLEGTETATLSNEHLDTSGYDQVKGTVTVTGLQGGETLIVRLIVHLECEVGATPTGNILNTIEAARVVGGDRISVGQQTVPMKQVGVLEAAPGIDVFKDCPTAVPAGEDIEYTITVTNTGNVDLFDITVVDDIIGDLSGQFPDTLAEGSDPVSVTVQYTPEAGDGDPITNTVTATGSWETGQETTEDVTDVAECTTDITHEPGILVVKECPESVPFGEDVTFTITVTNTGNEALENVLVTDALLGGDITAEFDFADPFPVGGEESAEFTYTPGPNEDPVVNSVTASGDGVDSEVTATSTDECDTDVIHAPAIQVTKSCPALVAFGEDVTFTITVTNTGNEDLENVLVTDALLGGDITSAFEFGETFAAGAEASAQFTYTPGADEDPVVNSVTASGDGVHSEITVTSTDDCVTDVSNPAISIVKTVSDEVVPVGTTVTYTYVITNTGDVTLYSISVDDDIMGHIGDIEVLEPGQSVTLTKDFVVGTDPVTNVGTAEGEDILGRVVRAQDDAVVSPISGNPPNPPNPPTPFTGSDAGRLGLITLVLLGIGVTVVASTRRRRSEGEAV